MSNVGESSALKQAQPASTAAATGAVVPSPHRGPKLDSAAEARKQLDHSLQALITLIVEPVSHSNSSQYVKDLAERIEIVQHHATFVALEGFGERIKATKSEAVAVLNKMAQWSERTVALERQIRDGKHRVKQLAKQLGDEQQQGLAGPVSERCQHLLMAQVYQGVLEYKRHERNVTKLADCGMKGAAKFNRLVKRDKIQRRLASTEYVVDFARCLIEKHSDEARDNRQSFAKGLLAMFKELGVGSEHLSEQAKTWFA